jgi:hypothetical protein
VMCIIFVAATTVRPRRSRWGALSRATFVDICHRSRNSSHSSD